MVDEETAAAYLRRIAVAPPVTADAATVRRLHRAHQVAVPFENLSIHLGEPISLEESDLADKIVQRRRGGFCYELNGLFALLLEALGARVIRVAARVYGDSGFSPPFDHLALVVRPADGSGPWLVDVGFGRHSDYPLLLDSRAGQDDPAGEFLLADAPDGIWTCSGTAGCSTGSNCGNGRWPTSSPPAGGSRPRRSPTSPSAPSARGSPRTAGSRSAAARSSRPAARPAPSGNWTATTPCLPPTATISASLCTTSRRAQRHQAWWRRADRSSARPNKPQLGGAGS